MRRALPRLLVAAIVLIAAAQALYYFTRTVDDLFISLRYADRLAAGEGLTYNPGERVEGFSSPAWVALQALGIALGLNGVTATKLLSLASLAGLLFAFHAAARRLVGVGPIAALALTAACAADSSVAGWAFWGLETPLYLALLLAFPVVLDAALERPGRATTVRLAIGTVALAACRPEAPLYVLALGAAGLAARSSTRRDLLHHLRALRPAVAVSGIAIGGLLVARRLYYGLWLPHTYYAKQGAGFDFARLRPLWTDGAHPLEIALVAGGLVLAVWLAARRRPAPLAGMLACAFFVGSVAEDWMPSTRHLLPVRLFALLAFGAALRPLAGRRVPAFAAAGVLAANAAYALTIDARYSPWDFRSHGGGRTWIRPKTAARFSDAWDALRHVPPPHVEAMSVTHHGQADPLYLLLEASSAPEAESWFLGQDIGLVGWGSPARVFDTAGLFTPDISDRGWRGKREVGPELAARAFARSPVAAELAGPWSQALARDPGLSAAYRVVAGSPRAPYRVVRRDVEPPAPLEIAARYDRALAQMPGWFYVSTLYGEAVGAAMEKRRRWVVARSGEPLVVDAPPADRARTGSGARLDDSVQWHGCRFEPEVVDPGAEAQLHCWFEATAPQTRAWQVFVHVVDAGGRRVLSADHAPASGWLPADRWPVGRVVQDAVPLRVPAGLAGQRLTARVGLFEGDHRARVTPAARADDEHRVLGPTLQVSDPQRP